MARDSAYVRRILWTKKKTEKPVPPHPSTSFRYAQDKRREGHVGANLRRISFRNPLILSAAAKSKDKRTKEMFSHKGTQLAVLSLKFTFYKGVTLFNYDRTLQKVS